MPDYTKAKIYKIVGEDGSTYYGSTTQTISRRLNGHKYAKKTTAYTKIISKMEFTIELVEEFPCSSKQELEDREAYYIRNYECVNKYIPLRTMKEYHIDYSDTIKQYKKQYRIDNKDKQKQYMIQYRIDNRDKQLQQMRENGFKRYHYINSWGGDPRRQNNLLQIDINIFA